MKSIMIENWIVLGKVIKTRLNYCKVMILESQGELYILIKDSVRNIDKKKN